MSPDKKRKADEWWAEQLRQHPQLQQKYGTSVPIGPDGKIPGQILTEVKQARTQELPYTVGGEQQQIQQEAPVNWREVGRDIVGGVAGLAGMPLSAVPGLDVQQRTERGVSALFGVEPRDFDIPEDAGLLRKALDPLMPAIEGIGTISERFLDPSAAVALNLYGDVTGRDPYGFSTAAEQLRQEGAGKLAALTGAYHGIDIPWYTRVPLEIATSPEELIPGVGMYAGATRLAAKQLGRRTAEEVAEEVAPVAAREVAERAPAAAEEVIMGGRAAEERLGPELQRVTTDGVERIQLKDPFVPTPKLPPYGPAQRVFSEEEVAPIIRRLKDIVGDRGAWPTERTTPLWRGERIPEGPSPRWIEEVEGIPYAQRRTERWRDEVAAPTAPRAIDDEEILSAIEGLSDIVNSGRPKATIIKRMESRIAGDDTVFANVAGMDIVTKSLDEYKGIQRSGIAPAAYREQKDTAFKGLQAAIDNLAPIERAGVDTSAIVRESIYRDVGDIVLENPQLFDESVVSGSDNLKLLLSRTGRYLEEDRGLDIAGYWGQPKRTPTEAIRAAIDELWQGEQLGRFTDDISQAVDDLSFIKPEPEAVVRGTDVSPVGRAGGPVPAAIPRGVESIMGTPEGAEAVIRQMELPVNETAARRTGRNAEVESSVNAVNHDAQPLVSLVPETTAFARKYKNGLIDRTKQLQQAIRDIVPADIMKRSLTKPAAWLTDRIGRQLVTRYEGVMNQQMAEIQNYSIDGARKLEAVGLGERVPGLHYSTERAFRLTETDWGTVSAPGPMQVLYRVLHGEAPDAQWISGSGMAHAAMAPEKAAQRQDILNSLREMTKFEEIMRIDFDPKIGQIEDYFYRGWKPAQDASGNSIPPNMSKLAAMPSYIKSRSTATFIEMMEAGFEPLYRNPFDQSVHSQQMGIKYRLQTELADILADESLGIAIRVEGEAGLQKLNTLHKASNVTWRVPKVGPAFEGKGYEIVKTGMDASGKPIRVGESLVVKANQIAVPDKVADTLESIFHGGTTWQKSYNQYIPIINKSVPVNVSKIVDALVFIPKRIKLFASLFQATDFMRRIGVGGTHGMIDAVWDGFNRGLRSDEAFDLGRQVGEARQSGGSIFKGWWEIVSSYGAAGKTDHFRNLLRDDTIKVMEGTDITWAKLVRNGLNVRDLTILPGDEMAILIDQIAQNAGFAKRMGRFVKELEYSSRRGLFDRVYPAAIMTDVKYNLLPMAKRAYPEASEEQIMALVARQANMKYSTLLRSQSNVTGFWRELLTRVMFSVNENEGLMRQVFRTFRSEEKAFWGKYWLSAGVFFGMTATTIHAGTTLVTEGKPRPLPAERFVPWRDTRKGWWKYGYNSRFLNPDIPIPTRSGERAVIDMLGQLDTAGRMLDFQEIPLDSFIGSRKGATVGAFHHLITGKDFYGRETDKFGHTGRILQFLYDTAVPIGMGEAGVGLVRQAIGDVELPSAGSFIRPDAQIKDVLPVGEPELGIAAMLAEATGENLKAPTSSELQRRMILNKFPDSDAKNLSELDYPEALQVEQYEGNRTVREELKTRTREGAAMDDIWDKQRLERDDVKSGRMQAEMDLVKRYDDAHQRGEAWSPRRFRDELSDISQEHRIRQDMISQKYDEDPTIKQWNIDRDNIPEAELAKMRNDFPVRWAEYKYITILKKYTEGDFTKLDYDKFNAELKNEQATWGEELVARYDAYRASKSEEQHSERATQYYQAMNRLENIDGQGTSWWDNPRLVRMVDQWSERMPKRRDGTSLRDEWTKWIKGSTEERARIEQVSGYQDTIRILKKERDRGREAILMNPQYGKEIERIVIEWFGRVPMHPTPWYRENLLLFTTLYKRAPSRMAVAN